MNLAIEEYLFRSEREDVIMLWQNEPSVIIGRNQNPFTEARLGYLAEKGIKLARRITGGGAVYHDLGNVNYTFISKSDVGGSINFSRFTAPIIDALHALGINASLNGRNDLVLESGEKFSGNAQHTENGRTLHHGTLLFDTDRDVIGSALSPDPEKLKSKAIRSVSARTANLKPRLLRSMSVAEFTDELSRYFISAFSAKEYEAPCNDETTKLFARNSSAEWLYPDRDLFSKYTAIYKKRFAFGTVKLLFEMKKDVICSARIEGDFFGSGDIHKLEEHLTGIKISEIPDLTARIDISEYIHGMSAEDLISIF